MIGTSATPSSDTRATLTQGLARCQRLSDCACGQQLDMCATAHCPRCGRTLGRV